MQQRKTIFWYKEVYNKRCCYHSTQIALRNIQQFVLRKNKKNFLSFHCLTFFQKIKTFLYLNIAFYIVLELWYSKVEIRRQFDNYRQFQFQLLYIMSVFRALKVLAKYYKYQVSFERFFINMPRLSLDELCCL